MNPWTTLTWRLIKGWWAIKLDQAVKLASSIRNGWNIILSFSADVTEFQVWRAIWITINHTWCVNLDRVWCAKLDQASYFIMLDQGSRIMLDQVWHFINLYQAWQSMLWSCLISTLINHDGSSTLINHDGSPTLINYDGFTSMINHHGSSTKMKHESSLNTDTHDGSPTVYRQNTSDTMHAITGL